MKIKNQSFYHFHRKGIKDDIWKVGNNFFIDENFRNNQCGGIQPICKDLPLIDKKIKYYTLVCNNYSPYYIREVMLELFRQTEHPDIISRGKCIYVCDENSVLYWSNLFDNKYELFKIRLNGEIFKSCSKFLPDMQRPYTYDELRKLSNDYWDPNFSDFNNEYFAEYLFQGSIIIEEKLDIEKVRNRYR